MLLRRNGSVSLATIHIYMVSLHRTLQIFWAVGTGAALWIGVRSSEPLAAAIYNHPVNLIGCRLDFCRPHGTLFQGSLLLQSSGDQVFNIHRACAAFGALAAVFASDG